ncbi:MAG: hypothetical protein ACYDFT_02675 [Thermoplasmata archaeon]
MTAAISPRRRGAVPTPACEIPGCSEASVRSLARTEVRKAFPALSGERGRAALCRIHYKEYKKATRSDRELERLDW